MRPIAKNIKRYFSRFKIRPLDIAVICVVIAISVTASIFVFNGLKRQVVINDNGETIAIKTMKATVGEVLEQTGIEVENEDYISMPFDAKLARLSDNVIEIKRAVPVTIKVDGKEYNVKTCKDTVSQVLADNNIIVSELDKFNGAQKNDKIVSNMNISITRLEENNVVETAAIPFKTITKENNRLNKGVTKTVREGVEGKREKTYKVVLEDGIQKSKQLLADVISSNPLDKIVEVGTVLTYNTSRGDTLRYSKVMNMKATSYTASYEDTGKNPGDPGFGITYTGVVAKRGIIAVDPKVIPLGTRVYVEVPGKAADYGYAVAADIGSAIKGNKIDVYLDTSKEVSTWGVKKVKVYILN